MVTRLREGVDDLSNKHVRCTMADDGDIDASVAMALQRASQTVRDPVGLVAEGASAEQC